MLQDINFFHPKTQRRKVGLFFLAPWRLCVPFFYLIAFTYHAIAQENNKNSVKNPIKDSLILLNDKIPLFVDGRVFEKEKLNFGSGDHLYGIEINSKDLDKLVDFKVVDVAKL